MVESILFVASTELRNFYDFVKVDLTEYSFTFFINFFGIINICCLIFLGVMMCHADVVNKGRFRNRDINMMRVLMSL